jgi:hypothetical protein
MVKVCESYIAIYRISYDSMAKFGPTSHPSNLDPSGNSTKRLGNRTTEYGCFFGVVFLGAFR